MKKYVVAVLLLGAAAGARADGLQNAGFESGDLTGWTGGGADWAVSATEPAHGGTHTAVNTSQENTSPGYQVLNQDLPVSEGDLCEGGLRVHGPAGMNSLAYFELQFLDGKGNVLEQYQSELTTLVAGFGFRGISSAPAPKGAEHVSVRAVVYHAVKPAVGETFVFDDVELTITPKPTSPETGKRKPEHTSTKLKPSKP